MILHISFNIPPTPPAPTISILFTEGWGYICLPNAILAESLLPPEIIMSIIMSITYMERGDKTRIGRDEQQTKETSHT